MLPDCLLLLFPYGFRPKRCNKISYLVIGRLSFSAASFILSSSNISSWRFNLFIEKWCFIASSSYFIALRFMLLLSFVNSWTFRFKPTMVSFSLRFRVFGCKSLLNVPSTFPAFYVQLIPTASPRVLALSSFILVLTCVALVYISQHRFLF